MSEKNIVIIDTDSETTLKIKSILESEGYTIYNASGKSESLSLSKKIVPSIIFINIAMKDVSGLEIAKVIHETETLSKIPIIMITPHGGTVEPRYTEMYGIVKFLKKSFTSEELISMVIDVTENQPPIEKIDESEISDLSDKNIVNLHEEPAEIKIPIETTAYSEDTNFQSVIQEEEDRQINENEEIKYKEIPVYDTTKPDEQLTEEKIKITSSEEKLSEEEEISAEDRKTDIDTSSDSISDNILEDTNIEKKAEVKSIAVIAAGITVFILFIGIGLYLFSSFSKKSNITPAIETSKQEQNITTAKIPEQGVISTPQETITDIPKTKSPAKKQTSTSEDIMSAKNTNKAVEPVNKQKIFSKPTKHLETKIAKQFYSVQFGVFKNEKFAKSLADNLSKNKYNIFIEKTKSKNHTILYRVLSGKFDNKKDAEKLSKEILAKSNIKTVIYKFK